MEVAAGCSHRKALKRFKRLILPWDLREEEIEKRVARQPAAMGGR